MGGHAAAARRRGRNRYRNEIHLSRYDPASIPDLGLTA